MKFFLQHQAFFNNQNFFENRDDGDITVLPHLWKVSGVDWRVEFDPFDNRFLIPQGVRNGVFLGLDGLVDPDAAGFDSLFMKLSTLFNDRYRFGCLPIRLVVAHPSILLLISLGVFMPFVKME